MSGTPVRIAYRRVFGSFRPGSFTKFVCSPLCGYGGRGELNLRKRVYLVIHDSGWVSLKHLLISRNPSHGVYHEVRQATLFLVLTF